MSLPKIRLEDAERIGPSLWRPDEAALRHLTKSLRLYEGAAVEGLSASDGKRYYMRLIRRGGDYYLESTSEEAEADGFRLTLLLGLLKQDQFDAALRACGELGVAEIAPLICERTVPRLSDGDLPKKMARWNKIIAEATQVSGAVSPPVLREPVPFAALDWDLLPATRLAAILADGASPLASTHLPGGAADAALAIGPEGDWSDAERDALLVHGFAPVSLGPRVLRASTAVTVAVSFIILSSAG